MTTHHTQSTFTGGMAFDSVIDDHHIKTDSTTENGGNNTGLARKG